MYILSYRVFTNFVEPFFANIFAILCHGHMGFSPCNCLMQSFITMSSVLLKLYVFKVTILQN